MDCFVARNDREGTRDMLTLYFAPGSSSFALHEIGVPFEANRCRSRTMTCARPITSSSIPKAKCRRLSSTDARSPILYYLAKRFPDAELLPRDDIEADAQALSWMSFAASTLHPARRHGLDHARDVWGIADRRLGSGWALESYSIADIHLFRLYWRFANSLKPAPDEFPNLTAHYARVMARPAVQRTIEIESAVGYELPG
jgi:glutathione S-transferase